MIECKVVKENSFLQFQFVDFNSEDEHLKNTTDDSKDQIEQIMELKTKKLSNVEIAKELGVSEGAIRRRIIKFHKRMQ